MNTDITQTLDARNLSCPLPIMRTKKALDAMQAGDLLSIQATDPGSVRDLESFCKSTGNTLISSDSTVPTDTDKEVFSFVIKKS